MKTTKNNIFQGVTLDTLNQDNHSICDSSGLSFNRKKLRQGIESQQEKLLEATKIKNAKFQMMTGDKADTIVVDDKVLIDELP
jgi:hypothetical protein